MTTTNTAMKDLRTLCDEAIQLWDADCDMDGVINEMRTALAQPEPEVDEGIDDLVAWLWSMRDLAGECNPDEQRRYELAATLLGQKAAETTHWRPATPQPSPVPVAMSADTLAAIIREVDGTHRLGANALAEAILSHPGSRWSPTIEPVPVAERLPGLKDCDAEGRCWLHGPHLLGDEAAWVYGYPAWAQRFTAVYSHWLPCHALPVPQQEVGRG